MALGGDASLVVGVITVRVVITDPAITALTVINPFCYMTIPITKALASYATTSNTIIVTDM